ncbi:MAG: MarR family transcriptional regulator [Mycobacterium sp.]
MSEKASRIELLAQLRLAGREPSDATVLFHSALAAELGLQPTDYKALGVLDRLGPMSAGDVGRHTGLAAASVTNLIDRLAA